MWVRSWPAWSSMGRKAGAVMAGMARWRKPLWARRASWPGLLNKSTRPRLPRRRREIVPPDSTPEQRVELKYPDALGRKHHQCPQGLSAIAAGRAQRLGIGRSASDLLH